MAAEVMEKFFLLSDKLPTHHPPLHLSVKAKLICYFQTFQFFWAHFAVTSH